MAKWESMLEVARDMVKLAREQDPTGVAELPYVKHAAEVMAVMRCGSYLVVDRDIRRCRLDRSHTCLCEFG